MSSGSSSGGSDGSGGSGGARIRSCGFWNVVVFRGVYTLPRRVSCRARFAGGQPTAAAALGRRTLPVQSSKGQVTEGRMHVMFPGTRGRQKPVCNLDASLLSFTLLSSLHPSFASSLPFILSVSPSLFKLRHRLWVAAHVEETCQTSRGQWQRVGLSRANRQ